MSTNSYILSVVPEKIFFEEPQHFFLLNKCVFIYSSSLKMSTSLLWQVPTAIKQLV